MVKIRHTQRYPLGTRVIKYFNGYKEPFEGSVDQHSDLTDFYHISYDDGDSEEMTEDDVEAHLLSVPKPRRLPKTLRKTKSAKASKPSTSPIPKKANSDKNVVMQSPVTVVPSVTSSKGKRRPAVLSLNANAPGLIRKTSLNGSPHGNVETRESLTISIPASTPKKVKEKEEEGEEEEMEYNENEEEGADNISPEGNPEEINLLVGRLVERTVTKEGCGSDTVQGAVASYFPATKKFRVMYFDGECCDLTYKEVVDSIPEGMRPAGAGGKKKRNVEESSRSGKRIRLSASSSSLKQPKVLDLNNSSSVTKVTDRIQRSPTVTSPLPGARSPSSPVVRESDMKAIDDIEFNIVRKVLFIIVSTVKNTAIEAQLEALSSADLKDKEALKMFVQKGGLTSLAELLFKWKDQAETEQGVLLILKTLAVLPGVTKGVIIESRIGKKVRGIEKRGSYKDHAIPGLATWVIQKLKADVGVQNVDHGSSLSVNDKAQREEEHYMRGLNSPKQNTSSARDMKRNVRSALAKSTDSSQPLDAKVGNGKTLAISNGGNKRSNSASHLLNLMSSRNGRDISTTRHDRDIFGNVVKKSKLGTSNNWRARRSTVVLDQVSKRLTENTEEVEIVKTRIEENDWKPSKISFAEDDAVCAFDKDVAVSKLLVFRPPGSTKAPSHPPVKPRSGPLRSILRAPIPPNAASENASPSNGETNAPPRASIVIPSDCLSLSSEVSRDGTTQSAAFNTSKLFNSVSPTELKKQGLCSPPCTPQSSLDVIDEVEGGKASASGNSDVKNGPLVETSDEPKPARTVKELIRALSPDVSEDDSSEDGEISSSDVEAATLSNCSTEPGIKASPVQQATATSA